MGNWDIAIGTATQNAIIGIKNRANFKENFESLFCIFITSELEIDKLGSCVKRKKEMRLNAAAKKLEDGIEEALTYMNFPSQHWLKIRTNNVIERLNRKIRRRTRVVGAFPDGNSALILVCARLRYVAGKDWGCKRYLCMKYLEEAAE